MVVLRRDGTFGGYDGPLNFLAEAVWRASLLAKLSGSATEGRLPASVIKMLVAEKQPLRPPSVLESRSWRIGAEQLAL